jgi:hypothetical protein
VRNEHGVESAEGVACLIVCVIVAGAHCELPITATVPTSTPPTILISPALCPHHIAVPTITTLIVVQCRPNQHHDCDHNAIPTIEPTLELRPSTKIEPLLNIKPII